MSQLAQAASLTNDIRDIRPPVEIANPWVWAGCALGVLVLGGLLLALLIYLLTRRRRIPPPPPIPAHIRAKQKLQEALALLAEPKPFCTAVSDAVRGYLEERFDFHAPERTTEEFLRELSGSRLLSPDQKDSLGEFLQCCDLVKFAKYEPGEPELCDLHASALRLVQETEPVGQTPVNSQSPMPDSQVEIINRKS